MTAPLARCIAFNVPVFYPFPENDTWWGKGFTEWDLVRGARPLFRGHTQPRTPAQTIGYYNPLQSEGRRVQAEMARHAGIEAFCYWHMWFGNGKMLLQDVVENIMNTQDPDFPFCLAWANQTWTRTWARSGTKGETLMQQTYPGEDDHRAHFAYVLPMFLDARYVRVHGKPLFILYRPFDIPDIDAFTTLWNSLAQDAGLPGVYFLGMVGPHSPVPAWKDVQGFMRNQPATDLMRYGHSTVRKACRGNILPLLRCLRGMVRRPQVFDHTDIAAALQDTVLESKEYPQVLANWDDTPRQGKNGTVLQKSSPALLDMSMKRAIEQLQSRPAEERLLFLKSWNEWGEGNYVEPDTVYGNSYLDAIRSAMHHV